jgi:antitoxin Phd
MDWRLADAKNRFSELFTQALTLGPQRVRRFKDAVVVLSEKDYERITGRRPNFKDYLTQGESFEGLDLARVSASPGQDVAP